MDEVVHQGRLRDSQSGALAQNGQAEYSAEILQSHDILLVKGAVLELCEKCEGFPSGTKKIFIDRKWSSEGRGELEAIYESRSRSGDAHKRPHEYHKRVFVGNFQFSDDGSQMPAGKAFN